MCIWDESNSANDVGRVLIGKLASDRKNFGWRAKGIIYFSLEIVE